MKIQVKIAGRQLDIWVRSAGARSVIKVDIWKSSAQKI